jgi:hypothetical protein
VRATSGACSDQSSIFQGMVDMSQLPENKLLTNNVIEQGMFFHWICSVLKN